MARSAYHSKFTSKDEKAALAVEVAKQSGLTKEQAEVLLGMDRATWGAISALIRSGAAAADGVMRGKP